MLPLSWSSQLVQTENEILAGSHIRRLKAPDQSDQSIRATIVRIANSEGTLVSGRSGHLIEEVIPKSSENSPLRSPSRLVGFDSIAFHLDGSHYPVPPRLLVLGCLSDDGDDPTLFIDTSRWVFSKSETSLLKSAVFFIRNGRKSFYSTIFGVAGNLCRFDPYCMVATGRESELALDLMNQKIRNSHIEKIHWQRGDIVILDNRRILHARGPVSSCANRILLRGAIR